MAVYSGPLPGATGYGMYQVQADEAYKRAMARIQDQRGRLLRESGYQGQYDAGGKMVGMEVMSGPGSEFGGYQQLTRSMADQAEMGEAQLRGRGFQGGGLMQQGLDDLQHGYAGQTHEFGQALLGGLGELGQAEQQAGEERNDALYNAMLENIRKATESGAFNPHDPGGIHGAFQPPRPPKPKAAPKISERARIAAQIRRNHPDWNRRQVRRRLRRRMGRR